MLQFLFCSISNLLVKKVLIDVYGVRFAKLNFVNARRVLIGVDVQNNFGRAVYTGFL